MIAKMPTIPIVYHTLKVIVWFYHLSHPEWCVIFPYHFGDIIYVHRFVRFFYGGCQFGNFCDVLVFLAKLLFPQSDNMFSCNYFQAWLLKLVIKFSQFEIYYMSNLHPPKFPTVWYFFNFLFISIILKFEL